MDAATNWIAGVEQDAYELLAQRNLDLEDEKARLAEQLERAEAELAEARNQLAMKGAACA